MKKIGTITFHCAYNYGAMLQTYALQQKIKDKGYKTITTIPAGDMVMLVNLYKHIKENDIQNDFINPHGKNEGKF